MVPLVAALQKLGTGDTKTAEAMMNTPYGIKALRRGQRRIARNAIRWYHKQYDGLATTQKWVPGWNCGSYRLNDVYRNGEA